MNPNILKLLGLIGLHSSLSYQADETPPYTDPKEIKAAEEKAYKDYLDSNARKDRQRRIYRNYALKEIADKYDFKELQDTLKREDPKLYESELDDNIRNLEIELERLKSKKKSPTIPPPKY